jgi:hypothetical protein
LAAVRRESPSIMTAISLLGVHAGARQPLPIVAIGPS